MAAGLAALLVAGAAPLAGPLPALALTVRDMQGREVVLPGPPRRIVSLVPSATEILYALGSDERLVGVTDYCDYPAAARQKPSVGGMVAPSLETIATLRPDLVIATPEGNREETFAQLRRLGIPVFLTAASRLSDVGAIVARLGELTEQRDAARALVRRITERIDGVRRRVAGRGRPRVLYVVWPEPLIVPGREALVTELIEIAGGRSITASEPDGYPRLGLEAAVGRQPDVIVMATHGAGTNASRDKWERLAAVPAIRSGRVHAADGNLLHRYTPRVVDGIESLARMIHPEAFP
jgi:iron complex transport system substrate-binding protein